MADDVLVPELSAFEQIKHRSDDGREFWYARELMKLLGNKLWQNFERVIEEAKAVVGQQGPDAVAINFIAINKNNSGDTRGRKGSDYQLTCHACYVIVQSGQRLASSALCEPPLPSKLSRRNALETCYTHHRTPLNEEHP